MSNGETGQRDDGAELLRIEAVARDDEAVARDDEAVARDDGAGAQDRGAALKDGEASLRYVGAIPLRIEARLPDEKAGRWRIGAALPDDGARDWHGEAHALGHGAVLGYDEQPNFARPPDRPTVKSATTRP